jgi:hypothetical protein
MVTSFTRSHHLKLLSKAILKTIPTVKHVIEQEPESRIIVAHLYNPIGVGDWFIMGGDAIDGDYRLFGLVLLDQTSFETFSLRELERLRLPFGEKVRGDKSFRPMTLADLRNNLHILF